MLFRVASGLLLIAFSQGFGCGPSSNADPEDATIDAIRGVLLYRLGRDDEALVALDSGLQHGIDDQLEGAEVMARIQSELVELTRGR